MTQDSGTIRLVGGTIRYSFANGEGWDLPLRSVRVIGEATNQNGPFVDDYFLCFACGPEGWYEASFYAEGREEFLTALAPHLGYRPLLQLANSADFASNVLWPAHLVGRPLFTFTPVPPRTWLGRVLGLECCTQHFSDEVLQELHKGV